jgi:hypothetical protein
MFIAPYLGHPIQPHWIIEEGESPNEDGVGQEVCEEGNDEFREHLWHFCESQQGNLGCPVVEHGTKESENHSLRDNWREEKSGHNMNEVLGQLICNVKLVTLSQSISFSLGKFAIITLAFVEELLHFLDDNAWFEQRQSRSCQHVDRQKNISFVNQSSVIEPFFRIKSIDVQENQCGVEETQDS